MKNTTALSVFEYGSTLPLLLASKLTSGRNSAGIVTRSKAWRPLGALNCFRFNLTRQKQNGPNSAFLLAVAALNLCGLSAKAQTYALDWHTIGGGSTSTGGVFAVSGTVGQPNAGKMSGGSFSIQGGFWAILPVQVPGEPLLTITRTMTNTVMISWPSLSNGFALQQSSNLNASNWSTPAESVNDNGTNKFIVVNPPSGNRFYRLIKP